MSRSSKAQVERLVQSAQVFAALGDETRLRLVARLCAEGPLPIARLSEDAPISRQAVTKHLHALADAGVAHGTRHGRERIWQIEPSSLERARHSLDRISEQWDSALARLKAFVEED